MSSMACRNMASVLLNLRTFHQLDRAKCSCTNVFRFNCPALRMNRTQLAVNNGSQKAPYAAENGVQPMYTIVEE